MMERTQTVAIQKYEGDQKDGKPIKFTGTLEDVKGKMVLMQKESLKPGKKRRTITTENRDKDKKLGLGIRLWVGDEKSSFYHESFWPVKLEKPKLI